eukprot:gene7323-8104_t
MATSERSPTEPARTFMDCVRQAAKSCKHALSDGYKLLEVEFPPLPLEVFEDSTSSARAVADANTRWAVEFARHFSEMGKVSIIYPDKAELEDALNFIRKEDKTFPHKNITLATPRADSVDKAVSIDQLFFSLFGATRAGPVAAVPHTKLYVAVVSSAQELPDLAKIHALDPSIPMVFFNLRLDQLRGDLGLPFFPSRDFHFRFLTLIKPAYLMRARSFATSLKRPPFIINYSGLLFRAYPEPFYSFLNTGDNKSKVVHRQDARPSTADFRDHLTSALVIPGTPSSELKTKGTELWWEKNDEKELSGNWRT